MKIVMSSFSTQYKYKNTILSETIGMYFNNGHTAKKSRDEMVNTRIPIDKTNFLSEFLSNENRMTPSCMPHAINGDNTPAIESIKSISPYSSGTKTFVYRGTMIKLINFAPKLPHRNAKTFINKYLYLLLLLLLIFLILAIYYVTINIKSSSNNCSGFKSFMR